MSRIKGGYYLQYGDKSWAERWLDTATGQVFGAEYSADPVAGGGFEPTGGGVWRNSWGYEFIPDIPQPKNWYVMRMTPNEPVHSYSNAPPFLSAWGPYTEADARANAALRSEKSVGTGPRIKPAGPYAVVQVQAGNTVVVLPPVPPAPVANWT